MNKAELIRALAELLAEKMELGEEPTNGEVFKAVFPDASRVIWWCILHLKASGWWEAPYKQNRGSTDD